MKRCLQALPLVIVLSLLLALGSSAAGAAPLAPAGEFTFYRWQALAPLPDDILLTELTIHPQDSREVYGLGQGKIFRSLDGGASWSDVTHTSFQSSFVTELIIPPSSPQVRYAFGWGTLFKSTDSGETWNSFAMPTGSSQYVVAPSNANILYAQRLENDVNQLIRSQDGGQTWTTLSPTLPSWLSSLIVSPADPNLLLASTWNQLLRSTDGGLSWQPAGGGTLYYPKPAFDPQPPHTLYVGLWRGMLRSRDGGATFEDGMMGSLEFSTILPSPWLSGSLLSVTLLEDDQEQGWQIEDRGPTWQMFSWTVPPKIDRLLRASNDGWAIYAHVDTAAYPGNFYRLAPWEAAGEVNVFLPALSKPGQPNTYPDAAVQAVDRMNVYRQQAGVPPFELHPAIVGAANNHANYIVINWNNPAAQANGAHGEVEGQPGFTGKGVFDRLVSAGWPKEWSGGGEIVHYIGNPVRAVDGWMATIYHRVIPLNPSTTQAGYGVSVSTKGRADVMNFGQGIMDHGAWIAAGAYPLGYPAEGQTGVPTAWSGYETPDPLPVGASHPVGYPFTLQGVNGTLAVTSASMSTSGGAAVALHPSHPDCVSFNCYAMIPVKPLAAYTTYVVTAAGSVGGVPFNRTWTFTTGPSATISTEDLFER